MPKSKFLFSSQNVEKMEMVNASLQRKDLIWNDVKGLENSHLTTGWSHYE